MLRHPHGPLLSVVPMTWCDGIKETLTAPVSPPAVLCPGFVLTPDMWGLHINGLGHRLACTLVQF